MQKSILVVEDDESIQHFLIGFLRDEGYIVEGFSSGARALEYVKKTDLI